jgi:translocation and assembly module TamA
MTRLQRGRPARTLPLAVCGLLALGAAQAQDSAAVHPLAPAAAASAPRPLSVPVLHIVAPDDVRVLLEKYLDLARAVALPDAASVGEIEWARLVAAAPAQIKTILQPLGYFNAQVAVARTPGTASTAPQVRLSVDPGPQAKVARSSFEVQGELAEQDDAGARTLRDALHTLWPLHVGAPFTNAAWSDAKGNVLAKLRAEGYASASWAGTAAEVDAATQGVRVVAVVDSGPLYLAGEIAVEGLQIQDADRVKALSRFTPKTTLTEAALLDYQERLIKTGLFDQVAVSLEPYPANAAAAKVLVQLREAPRQAATVGLGYSANTGPRTSLEHVNRRLFDHALTARNKFVLGRDEQSWNGEISTHPDAEAHRYILGGTLDRLLTSSDLVLSQRVRLGRSTEARGLEKLLFAEAERARECGRAATVVVACSDLIALSGNLHLTWRELDNAVLPTRGYTLQWQGGAGLASGSGTQRGPYGRLYARATGYLPLGQSWFGQARLEGGRVFSAGDVVVPDSQRFRAGGDDSVRGYPYRTLAPTKADGSVTGGRMEWTASAEIARPFTAKLPSVWWAAFLDAGRAADTVQDLSPALGYGLGVRWRSPVGPLRLDLAWGQELHKLRLHMSVGIAF